MGNDNATATAKVTGGTIPARIWHDYMIKALAGVAATPLPVNYKPQMVAPSLPWLQGTPDGSAGGGASGYTPSAPLAPGAAPAQPKVKLEKSFWDKLMDDGKVEYDYPSAR